LPEAFEKLCRTRPQLSLHGTSSASEGFRQAPCKQPARENVFLATTVAILTCERRTRV